MKALFKLNLDYGRMGRVEGLFLEEKEHMDFLVEKELVVNFGEVIGKYSDVCARMSPGVVTMITTDEKVLQIIEENRLEIGYNPLKYPLCQYPKEGEVDICFDDWTAEDYIKWELTLAEPGWYKKEDYYGWKND